MTVTIVILTMVLLAAVVWIVSGPLRALGAREDEGRDAVPRAPALDPEADRHEVETAREAKYREIRDAELDFRTGKLSREDYEAIDAQLRAEALALLDRIDAAAAGARPEREGSGPQG